MESATNLTHTTDIIGLAH